MKDYNFIQMFSLAMYAIIAVFIFYERNEYTRQTFSKMKKLLYYGISLLMGAMLFNSLIENNWGLKYILDFLILKEVGDWFFQIIASIAYYAILIPIETYLIIVGKERGIIQAY